MTPRIVLPATIDPAALRDEDRGAPVVTLSGETMGTSWRVLFAGRVSARAVDAAIVARLRELVAQTSHWEPASALSRFNDAPAGTWMLLPADLAHVMRAGMGVARATGGAFDPAIGALVDLWGFGPPGPRDVPGDAQVAQARARAGFRRLTWRTRDRLLHQPGGVRLDLSGIAKGYAVDAVVAVLAAHGIRHCLVEIGGELRGCGLRPDGDPWWVDIEPMTDDAPAPLRLALHGLAVATSGTYVRGDHTIDPRTGYPPPGGVVAVTAIARTAMVADAVASAALVAWPDLSGDLLSRADLRIVVRDGDTTREVVRRPAVSLLDTG